MKSIYKNVTLKTNQRGALLIGLILAMMVTAILGSAMIYLTTTATFAELYSNHRARAYYLAEAGSRFALPIIISDLNKGITTDIINENLGKTFTVDSNNTNNKFDLSISTVGTYTILESTGKVNELPSWFYAKQKVTWKISSGYASGYNDPFTNLDNWNKLDTGEAFVKKVDKDGSVSLKVDPNDPEALIGLKWSTTSPTSPVNLLDVRNKNDGLLNYNLQVKFTVSPGAIQDNDFFLSGLSFRLDRNNTNLKDDDKYYGLSFFWAKSISLMAPGASATGTSLKAMVSGLEDDKMYVILYKKDGTTLSLIDYKILSVSEYPNLVEYRASAWKSTKYSVGEFVKPTVPNGSNYVCIAANNPKNSSATEPTWPTTTGATVVDGDLTWQETKTGTKIKDWSTLLVMVKEEYTDKSNDIRRNRITAYVQGNSAYPRSTTPYRWVSSELDASTDFSYVNWFLPQLGASPEVKSNPCDSTYLPSHCSTEVSQTLLDYDLTTVYFEANAPTYYPDEIGLHSFQNSNANREMYFDDFSLNLAGTTGTAGVTITQY